jgi:hypothetical protein
VDPHAHANRNVPGEIRREITRYGGLNPFGRPSWRVVWAQNVLEQTFGSMRHMPRVGADIDLAEVEALEPQFFESGELWIPRYQNRGAILERWFPASAWGSQITWESEVAEDGVTRLKGEWPRHGDYFMVGDEFYAEMPSAGFWKDKIQLELRRMANAPVDPATYLANCLHIERSAEAMRREAFIEEVNHIHRHEVEPMLATVGTTAQRVRDELMDSLGMEGHLAAG